jgi:hypothetical protein
MSSYASSFQSTLSNWYSDWYAALEQKGWIGTSPSIPLAPPTRANPGKTTTDKFSPQGKDRSKAPPATRLSTSNTTGWGEMAGNLLSPFKQLWSRLTDTQSPSEKQLKNEVETLKKQLAEQKATFNDELKRAMESRPAAYSQTIEQYERQVNQQNARIQELTDRLQTQEADYQEKLAQAKAQHSQAIKNHQHLNLELMTKYEKQLNGKEARIQELENTLKAWSSHFQEN